MSETCNHVTWEFNNPNKPQLNSINTKAGIEVEHYHTCVNPMVKFCHNIYYSFSDMPKIPDVSFWLPSLGRLGLKLCQIVTLKVIRCLKSLKKNRSDQERVIFNQ